MVKLFCKSEFSENIKMRVQGSNAICIMKVLCLQFTLFYFGGLYFLYFKE
ncbi:hypothetical protein BACCIP111883_01202 [Sutcliffiella rhizosphaerae]|uniref:Uncharacterized protein n=1 Tax=Sutcliffiella rhizosphaerae TaxID=2880967 RepID=A0ABN8A726_9BACI|nr:hypothetical protein BACCIP111883_01202 [Sutcliffiella rhizosphaerae]